MQSYEILFLRVAEMRAYFESGLTPDHKASLVVTSSQGAANIVEIPQVGDLVNFKRHEAQLSGVVDRRMFIYDDKTTKGLDVDLSVQVLIFVKEGEV